jgi:hypothetical protein
MRSALIIALLVSPAAAKVNVTTVAAVSTIAVNVLDIKPTFHKAKKAAVTVMKKLRRRK